MSQQLPANKQARMTRAWQLLNQYPNLTVNMFFTDEKLFTVAAPTNSQNDRFYVRPSGYQKEERQQKPTPSNEIDIQQISR